MSHALIGFLAGLPSAQVDDFGRWRTRPSWMAHAARLTTLFEAFDATHARPFREWASRHIAGRRPADVLFYPFSGPDAIYAHLVHPEARTYVLCGLEPCDELPHAGSLDGTAIDALLPRVVAGLEHYLRHAYFVTSQMRASDADRWAGTLLTLLICLARLGHTIAAVEWVRLDAGGRVHLAEDRAAAHGVRVAFDAGGIRRQLFYFTQDLRDDVCGADAPMFRFVAGQGAAVAFLKSASYLPHEPDFSHVRQFLFAHCETVIQDPSGLPYRSFRAGGWEVDVQGRYAHAPRVFPQYEQSDLAAACRQDEAARLPFAFGYQLAPGAATLMIAAPRTDAAARAAVTRPEH